MRQQRRPTVFISYSHHDHDWLEKLLRHLRPLQKEDIVDIWVDTRIEPGERWRQEIDDALSKSAVAVLLISASFLDSEFITTQELPRLLAAARDRGVKIIPLLLKPTHYAGKLRGLTEFQLVNSPTEPLISLTESEQEELFAKVAKVVDRYVTGAFRHREYPERKDKNLGVTTAVAESETLAPRLVHTRFTARGLLDDDKEVTALYRGLFGPFEEPDRDATISIAVHAPSDDAVTSSRKDRFLSVVAICSEDLGSIARKFESEYVHLTREETKKHFERKENILSAAAGALDEAFVLAVAVPPVILRAGSRGRAQIFYESLAGLFLVPLLDFNREQGVRKIDVGVASVGGCTGELVKVAKRAAESVYSGSSWSWTVGELPGELQGLENLAWYIRHAVERLYNENEKRWIGFLRERR